MFEHKILTVLTYSSIDKKFLEENLNVLVQFSEKIVVPTMDHFWNGEQEETNFLDETAKICSQYKNTNSVPIIETEENILKNNSWYWENKTRTIGIEHVLSNWKYDLFKTWILLVDTDEIFEVDGMRNIIENLGNSPYTEPCNTISFPSYFYFRTRNIRAKKEYTMKNAPAKLIRAAPLLKCPKSMILQVLGRPVIHDEVFAEGDPFLHHYSWVRSYDEMLKKTRTYGHRHDRDWVTLINEEFSHPPCLPEKCFVAPKYKFEYVG